MTAEILPGINPKDLAGRCKVNLTAVPDIGVIHEAAAMMDGQAKYGPYNWRENPIIASVYVAAARRHLAAWFGGEEVAADSGAHHLGHARACLGILLDAQAYGNLHDDRPISKATTVVSGLLDSLANARLERTKK